MRNIVCVCVGGGGGGHSYVLNPHKVVIFMTSPVSVQI